MAKPVMQIDMPSPLGGPSHAHLAQRLSPKAPPRVVSPWPGNITSPGINVAPEAVDYFHRTTSAETSTRALTSLALVAGGRVTVAMGLGGVSTGFQKGAAHPYALGGVGVGVGLVMAAIGITRSYRDTAQLNVNRARVSAVASSIGALLIAGGGIFVSASVAQGRTQGVYEALPMRAVGNFLVFGSVPNAFSAAEIVHGDVPIPHRILARDLSMALAGAFLMTWAHISTVEAPLWAREIAQCGGIVCLALSGALARTDMSRAQANARAALQRRRASSVPIAL